uniref:Glycosyltransferase n=1 Tax=Nemophila menziesii TaxID=79376 RepID=A0A387II23_NEMME|nr:glucosyltransferase 11 [Nemophila menziesii]
MDSKKHTGARVFLLPYVGYGHTAPAFELAIKLIERGLYVYFCITPSNLKLIQKKIEKKSSLSHSIQLVEFDLPSYSDPDLPQENHTTRGIPLHQEITLDEAIEMTKPSVSNILKNLNPDLIIFDPLFPWMEVMGPQHNIPIAEFVPGNALICSYFKHIVTSPADIEFPFPKFRLSKFDRAKLDKFLSYESSKRTTDDAHKTPPSITLINTSRAMEGKFLDYYNDVKVMPVGHLVQEPDFDDQDKNIEVIEWLGKQNKNSTVFVSFGTQIFLQKEEIEEIAYGLELSDENFIWTIKFHSEEDDKAILPEGFLERIGDKGRVIEGWVPQQYILNHPNIGGFVSHCGWNSTLESLEFGVPLIAMPIHWDQPLNAKLLMEIGIGLEVTKDENGKFHRDEIAKAIKDVIVGDTAEEMRKQIKIMREKVKMNEKEEMDIAFQAIVQLCNKGSG